MNRRSAVLFAVAIIGAGLVGAVGSSAPAAACVTIKPLAHRGGTEHYIENTRDAFRDASNRGAPNWETDVQFTADDQPVIMHDDTVDRTTNGIGTVASFTLAQIEQLRTADDQPIPTLRDLVNDAQVDGAHVYPELKTVPTDAQWTNFAAALNSRAGDTARVTVTSFIGQALTEAQTRIPGYPTALIAGLGDQTAASVTQYGAHILFKHHDSITSTRLAAWNTGGLTVYAWTVDDPDEWARMAWYPTLAGVITDTPQAYLAWQKARTC